MNACLLTPLCRTVRVTDVAARSDASSGSSRCVFRYPEVELAVELQSVRGMGDERAAALSRRLQNDARAMRGELSLMVLCMTAREQLTTANHADGVAATPCMALCMALCMVLCMVHYTCPSRVQVRRLALTVQM